MIIGARIITMHVFPCIHSCTIWVVLTHQYRQWCLHKYTSLYLLLPKGTFPVTINFLDFNLDPHYLVISVVDVNGQRDQFVHNFTGYVPDRK